MSRSKYSQKREDFIQSQTDKLNKRIAKTQKKFYEFIAQLLEGIPVDENGLITPNNNLPFLPSKLDKFYDDFLADEIKPIMEGFASNVGKLFNQNKKYFDTVKKSDKHDGIKEKVFEAIGISGSVVLGGSLLYSILSDRKPIQVVKSLIMSSAQSGLSITSLKSSIEQIVLKNDGGAIKSLFEETIPDPYVKLDRFIGNKYASELSLNYAIYQGGLIKTSRPFCIERNNKVFSREEIRLFGTPQDKFGGYENKATGEFQGKTNPYDPFTDLGGYNCRHAIDWISDELAFHLRPGLKQSKLN